MPLPLIRYMKRREGKASFGPSSGGRGNKKKKDLFELVESSGVTSASGTFSGFRTLEEPPDIINGGSSFDTAAVTTATGKDQEDDIVKEKPDDHLDEEQSEYLKTLIP